MKIKGLRNDRSVQVSDVFRCRTPNLKKAWPFPTHARGIKAGFEYLNISGIGDFILEPTRLLDIQVSLLIQNPID